MGRRAWLWPLLLAVMVGLAPASADDGPRRLDVDLGDDGTLRWEKGSTPVILTAVRRGEGWIHIARRVAGSAAAARAINRANPDLDHPLRDRPVRVPLEVARGELRVRAMAMLFPVDRRVEMGFRHYVLEPFDDGAESWEWLAAVYTGDRARAAELRRANPELAAAGLRRGAAVLVPEALLVKSYRRLPVEVVKVATPTATPGTEEVPTRLPGGGNGLLTYSRDERGEYAVYHLRRGEALYSAVVVRFTGQLLAKEVNETALEIAERSGIDDVTSIPIGFPVKIPMELLLPEHLPKDSEAYRAWLAERKELAGFFEVVHATDLSGVHVIIDAGHGGKDTGAVFDDVWEATYAHDLAVRIKANLERHTRATVWMTREDERSGLTAPAVDRLPQHRQQFLRTRPPYTLGDSKVGVHLRWCLGNDIVRRLAGEGVPASRVVFLSVHADSLHPSVRGSMAYVASRSLRGSGIDLERRTMAAYAEYRANRKVSLPSSFRARAEASSRHLAETILARLEANEFGIHPHVPVRDRVRRGRSTWVPAVLKYSLAQNAVLLECCNLANAEDRALILDHGWRERFARAVVEGLAAAFDS